MGRQNICDIYEIGDVQRKKDTRPSEATLTQFL